MDDCIESDIVFKWTYFCRLCLTPNADINIFDGNLESSKEIINNLQTELKLLAYVGDPMPQKLCGVCAEQLTSWQKFKQKCIESDANLKKRLIPFQSLDFVRSYLEKAAGNSCPPISQSVKAAQDAIPFPVMSVKTEPFLEDSPAKDTGISSANMSVVGMADSGQSGHMNNDNSSDRGGDWSECENSADTVYDDPVMDTSNCSSGLNILRQMLDCNQTGTVNAENEAGGDCSLKPEGPHLRSATPPLQEVSMQADETQENNCEEMNGIDGNSNKGNAVGTESSLPTIASLEFLNGDNQQNVSTTTPMIGVVRIENLLLGGGQKRSEPSDIPDGETSTEVVSAMVDSIVMNVEIKEEPREQSGSLMATADSRKYNLRRRREANYGDDDDWPEEKRHAPAPQKRLTPWKCEVCNVYFSSFLKLEDHHSSDRCLASHMDCYSCLICSKKFLSENSLAEHNLKHVRVAYNKSVDELVQCRKCDLAFADPWRRKQHNACHAQKSIPSQAPQYPCHDCGLVFIKQATYEEHQKSHEQAHASFQSMDYSVPPERDYGCSLCISRFKSEDFLYDHRFAVHGIADERVVCPTCSSKFRDEVSLVEHIKSHTSRGTARKTTNPFLKISNLRTLEKEKEPQSLVGGSVRCRRCGVVFLSPVELARHEATKHKNPTPYLCRKCNRKFPTRSLLLMHHREHSSGTSLLDGYQLAIEQPTHESTLTTEKLDFIAGMTCYRCSIKFMTESDIQQHLEAHKKFGTNTEFTGRMDSSYILKYQCCQCPQLFCIMKSSEKHNMTKHGGTQILPYTLEVPVTKSNVPIPRYQCQGCQLDFNCKASLNFHIKIKHGGDMRMDPSAGTDDASSLHEGEASPEAKAPMPSRAKQIQEDEENRRRCKFCLKHVSNSFNLKKHESTHTSEYASRHFKCRHCDKSFPKSRYSSWQGHERRCGKANDASSVAVTPPTPPRSAPPADPVANSDPALRCAVCGNTYETRSLLDLHTMTAHGLVSLKPAAPVREKSLWQEEDNKIVRQVNGVLGCTLCQVQFETTDAASWHRSQHPRGNLYIVQVDESLFQCTVCDQLLTNRKHALLHAVSHAQPDIKPLAAAGIFNCPFCSSVFSSEESIRNHIFFVHPGGSSNKVG